MSPVSSCLVWFMAQSLLRCIPGLLYGSPTDDILKTFSKSPTLHPTFGKLPQWDKDQMKVARSEIQWKPSVSEPPVQFCSEMPQDESCCYESLPSDKKRTEQSSFHKNTCYTIDDCQRQILITNNRKVRVENAIANTSFSQKLSSCYRLSWTSVIVSVQKLRVV